MVKIGRGKSYWRRRNSTWTNIWQTRKI